jgi:MerR family transcriptional regulator/heat shock protein HspR
MSTRSRRCFVFRPAYFAANLEIDIMRRLDNHRGLFTIGVAADILGVAARVLRLYEKKGLIQPRRTESNRRLYSIEDLEKLEFVHYMTHVRKVNLAGVEVILELLERMPEQQRAAEVKRIEELVDQLDSRAKRLFAEGSAAVAEDLLDSDADAGDADAGDAEDEDGEQAQPRTRRGPRAGR